MTPAYHLQTLTGCQTPVVGRSPHCLIPHIPIVNQILHQCVQVACGEKNKRGLCLLYPQASPKARKSPCLSWVHAPASLLSSKYSTE